MVKGRIISGEFGNIMVRQKSDAEMEIGELLVAETPSSKILMQVIDLVYGSQLSQQNLELVSGLKLEENADLDFMDPELRNYNLAVLKNLVTVKGNSAVMSKSLPQFFSEVRQVEKDDIKFLTKPKNPLFAGKLRSGSKTLDVDIFLRGDEVFSHHILIPATTGKGKSNLTSCLLWDCVDKDYCGILVLDPHDEYYGRTGLGLKDHPLKDKVIYYTPKSPPPGARSLRINIKSLRPHHFNGVANFSDAQRQGIAAYHRRFKENWVAAILLEEDVGVDFHEATLAVLKRRLMELLDIDVFDAKIICNDIFVNSGAETTVEDICNELEKARTVIIDTSSFAGAVEILIGSLVSTEIFRRYRNYKMKGQLKDKPVISIILEEAPRVLGKEVLEQGQNIFASIAREGRKFQIGLVAITQLPSLIPREILANMNTKIILGIEMAPERQSIIDSASQDLSADNRTIASLDIGEAIISSNFVKFATPIKIPLFETLVKEYQNKHNAEKYSTNYSGVKLK